MNRLGGSVAPRGSSEDPKVTALRESRCLNPHSGQVTDQAFLTEEFFDARDAVQVKYEMVRRVTVDGAPVTATAAAFGYSRPSYYPAAALHRASADPPPGAPQKPLTYPPLTAGRRTAPSLSLRPSPGPAAAEPG